MPERIVINTGPLIALARADALDLIAKLPFEYAIPPAVRAELDAGSRKGYPSIELPWLRVIALKAPPQLIAQVAIDRGEAEVLQLALEQGIRRVCLDDWKGRRMATAIGLSVTGSLGLLARAKKAGLIPALRPMVDKLMRAGEWYEPELVRRVLEGVGE